MRLWGYYAFHTFINSIKKIFRSTFLIVMLCAVGFGLIFGLSAGLVGSIVGDHLEPDTEITTEYAQQTTESTESIEATGDTTDAAPDSKDNGMSPEEIAAIKTFIAGGSALLFLGLLLWGIYSGTKNGTDIFLMADVNFLFTAPMKPQKVLLFRLSFQVAATILASIYLIFQIPNLINAGLGTTAILGLFAGWIFLLVTMLLVKVFSYTIFTTHEGTKKYVLPCILVIIGGLALWIGGTYLAADRDLVLTAKRTVSAGWFHHIPLIGWYQGMIMSTINEQISGFFLYTALLIVCLVALFLLTLNMKADFYEDALASASKREEILNNAREGRAAKAKKRSAKTKEKERKLFGGSGASTFLTKAIYCRRRDAYLGVATATMVIYLGASVLITLLCTKILEYNSFLIGGCGIMLIMFFRNFTNPIEEETSLNWLFLVPENPYKKVFYAMLGGTYGAAIDLLPALIFATIWLQANPLLSLLWYITLLVVDFMLSTVGVFLEAMIPATAVDVAKAVVQMMLRMSMLFVLVVFMVVGYLVAQEVGMLIVTMLASIGIGTILFIFYPTMLHAGVK